jgi:hypothetical protein
LSIETTLISPDIVILDDVTTDALYQLNQDKREKKVLFGANFQVITHLVAQANSLAASDDSRE